MTSYEDRGSQFEKQDPVPEDLRSSILDTQLWVAIEVADTGPGIPEEELEHVFERHYRGQNITGKGAGLGLAIVKRLCELYGWSIHFSNRETGGLRAELRFFGS